MKFPVFSLLAGNSAVQRRVRSRLSPPAESQVRTCLSREFAFLRREAAVFRGCAPLGWRRGRRRRAGWSNIAPRNGNISVGPYSSTAVLPARFRDRGGDGSQVSGLAGACRFRLGVERGLGSRKSEQGALLMPGKRQARVRKQLVCRQIARLAPVEDSLGDVGGEMAEADEPREIGRADPFPLG